MVPAPIEETGELLRESLRGELWEVAEAIRALGVSDEQCVSLVHNAGESRSARRPIEQLRSSVKGAGVRCAPGSVEKLLLTRAALRALPSVPSLAVSEPVRELLCQVFQDVAVPPTAPDTKFTAEHAHFGALCKFASLRRFPAGEYDWDESGVPRSYVLRVDRRQIPRLLHFVATRVGGFAPLFYLHVGLYRNHRSLTEPETDRSYYRVAQALKQHPRIRGCMGAPWFCSPDVLPVSPHLSWISENYRERGALVIRLGPPDPHSGALSRSETRRRLYESGTYKPTKGLVIWPRAAVLAWAEAHPELAD